MRVRDLSLKARLLAVASIALLGSLALLSFSRIALQEIKVKGPMYESIVANKDLVADILPPPEYIIEDYLICYELMRATDKERDELMAKVVQLQKDYEERFAVWDKYLTHPGLRQSMLKDAAIAAREFFKIQNEVFLPKVRESQFPEAQEVLSGPLTEIYKRHRAAIDTTVTLANAEVETVEANAVRTLDWYSTALYLAALVINILVLGLTFLVIRSILRPMSKLMSYARDLSAGQYDAEPLVRQKDELGELSEVLVDMSGKVKENVARAQAASQQAAEEADKARTAKAEGMLQAASELEGMVDVVTAASEELATQIEQSSSFAAELSSSVAEISSTMEELSTSASQIAQHSQGVVERADKTLDDTRSGASEVGVLTVKINDINSDMQTNLAEIVELGRRSKEITKIMEIINNLANQTKLIGFNAALEAASAGESGKRFGVVASEIRRLANNVVDSTGEIEGKITEILDAVNRLVMSSEKTSLMMRQSQESASHTVSMLNSMVDGVEESTDSAKQISLSTQQQQIASSQVLLAMREIDKGVRQSTDSAHEANLVAGELRNLAGKLKSLVNTLKTGHDGEAARGQD